VRIYKTYGRSNVRRLPRLSVRRRSSFAHRPPYAVFFHDSFQASPEALTLFRRLGVHVERMTRGDFRISYLALAKRYHPDRNANINATRTAILNSYRNSASRWSIDGCSGIIRQSCAVDRGRHSITLPWDPDASAQCALDSTERH
jgi:hypothetical protein